VVAVEPASPAAVAGIRPGDVLVTINGFEVPDRRSYRHLHGQMSGHSEPVQVLVRTGTMENYLLLHSSEQGMEQ